MDIEFTFTAICLLMGLFASCTLAYICLKKFTILRGACLISSLINISISIINLLQILPQFKTKYFWSIYLMASSLYVTVMLSYLLQTGRRFYHRSSWNDPFRNIAIISIIILNFIYWISSIRMLYRKDGQPYISTCILAAVFWMISLIFSFLYAFNPVLATHFGNRQANDFDNNDKKNTVNKNECQEVERSNNTADNNDNNNNNTADNNNNINSLNSLNSLNEISITTNIEDFQLCRINSTNTSVGLWYMIIMSSIINFYIIYYIIIFSIGSSILFTPISNSIDLILRICLVIVYGIPPSPKILEFLSQKILKNNKNNSLALSVENT
ncbi:hypothetical protein C2G38_2128690, partial [Gigaspora rosea]